MSKEIVTAAAKVSWPVAWLSGEITGFWQWMGGVNWGVVTGALTALYTILMMIHLLAHWNQRGVRSEDDGNLP